MTPGDYDRLYDLATCEQNGYRWRFRGTTPSPEAFVHSLWNQVLAQFAVTAHAAPAVPVGLVVANRADFRSQHCYLAAVLEPGAAPTGWGMEVLGLFISYLFESFNLRKIYFESLSFNLSQFASGIGRFFVEEGRLRGHDFYGGRWWDLHVMAIYREQWIERGAPLVAAEASQPRHPVIRVPAGGGHDSGHGGRDGL